MGTEPNREGNNLPFAWTYSNLFWVTGPLPRNEKVTFMYDPATDTLTRYQQDGLSATYRYDQDTGQISKREGELCAVYAYEAVRARACAQPVSQRTTFVFSPAFKVCGYGEPEGFIWPAGADALLPDRMEPGSGAVVTLTWEGAAYPNKRHP